MNLNFPYKEPIAVRDHELRVTRRFTPDAEFKVRQGAKVQASTIIAKVNPTRVATQAPIADELGVPPSEAEKLLLKQPGAVVAAGEPLAKTRRGLRNVVVNAPVTGLFLSFDASSGVALIVQEAAGEVSALVPGDIDQCDDPGEVIIRTVGTRILGIVGIGGATSGPVRMVVDRPDSPLEASKIGPQHEGCIVIGGACADALALRRLIEVRAGGLVVGGLLDRDVIGMTGVQVEDRLSPWRLSPSEPVLGENLMSPLTIMATEGFGRLPINPESFILCQELEGQMGVLIGDTRISGELIRPELVVPNADALELDGNRSYAAFAEGAHVRIVDHAMLGLTGIVVGPPRRIRRGDGQALDLVDVQIHGGGIRAVTIPNLEIVA
jgi:hypothetical protein